MEETQLAVKVQTPRTPAKSDRATKPKSNHQTPMASRFTRSQVVPDWTVPEMLVLVNEIVAVNEDCLKTLPSYQKWKMISDNMAILKIVRSSNQCQRKWQSLLAEYKKLKSWESRSGIVSYWCLECERKKEFGLPAFFDKELFGLIDDFLKSQGAQLDLDMDSDSEGLTRKVKTRVLGVSENFGLKKEVRRRSWKSNLDRQAVAGKLEETAQLIHAILGRELTDSVVGGCTPADTKNPMELKCEMARQQADELIKVFGTLVDALKQFRELV